MADKSRGLRLLKETLCNVRIAGVGAVQHLNRHRVTQIPMLSGKDSSHPALADEPQETIVAELLAAQRVLRRYQSDYSYHGTPTRGCVVLSRFEVTAR